MTFAGIDVSKPHLDLALVSNSPKPTRLRFPNTPEGRQALLGLPSKSPCTPEGAGEGREEP